LISRTISICQGKGSIGHNNRTFHTKNTDPARTKNNIVFVREPIGTAYEKLFAEAVKRYNAKQKRSDRKIKNGYFEYQFGQPVTETKLTSPDKRKSFYEYLIQLGTMEDTGVGTEAAEKATTCLCEYMKGFPKRNPNFYIFNAVIHLDEKTPHLHIDYVPVGHYKRGVDTQNGIAQALKEMGYGTGKNAIAKWRQSEYLVFRRICEEQGFIISEPKKSRGVSFAVEEYKEIQQEKERLSAELQPLREMELVAEETVVIGKKQLLSHNITVSPEELEKLEQQKKAVAVQSIDNQYDRDKLANRKQALDEREADIAVKENESLSRLADISSQLDKRESEITMSEHRVIETLSDAQRKNDEAERKMESADRMYEKQLELNKKYSELERDIQNVKRERDWKSIEIRHIRQALGIPYNDEKTDAEEKINGIRDELHTIDQLLSDELRLPWSQMKNTTPLEMLHMLIDRFKNRISETDKELEESRSVIAKLKEQLSFIKQEFVKVVLAVNTLVYSDKYCRGLSGLSKALATGISFFTDSTFKKLGEYDSINKCAIDDEIRENMNHFIEPENSRTSSYYER
jgi:hypothetical protein